MTFGEEAQWKDEHGFEICSRQKVYVCGVWDVVWVLRMDWVVMTGGRKGLLFRSSALFPWKVQLGAYRRMTVIGIVRSLIETRKADDH